MRISWEIWDKSHYSGFSLFIIKWEGWIQWLSTQSFLRPIFYNLMILAQIGWGLWWQSLKTCQLLSEQQSFWLSMLLAICPILCQSQAFPSSMGLRASAMCANIRVLQGLFQSYLSLKSEVMKNYGSHILNHKSIWEQLGQVLSGWPWIKVFWVVIIAVLLWIPNSHSHLE